MPYPEKGIYHWEQRKTLPKDSTWHDLQTKEKWWPILWQWQLRFGLHMAGLGSTEAWAPCSLPGLCCGLGFTRLGWALLRTTGALSLFLFLRAPSWARHHCPSAPNHKSHSSEEWERDHQWLREARSTKRSLIPAPRRLQGKMAPFWPTSLSCWNHTSQQWCEWYQIFNTNAPIPGFETISGLKTSKRLAKFLPSYTLCCSLLHLTLRSKSQNTVT